MPTHEFGVKIYYYRPQTKFAKVMFLHASVILSTEGGSIPACLAAGLQGGVEGNLAGGGLQAHTQGEVEGDLAGGVSRPTPRGKVEGDLARGGCLQANTQGGLQVHTWGVSIPACTEADPPPPDGFCSGQYASYWNAFLFAKIFAKNELIGPGARP